jgi:DNA-binding NtrC family response regulator
METTIKAMQLGAFEYVRKPIDTDELELTIDRAIETVQRERNLSQIVTEISAQYRMNNLVGSTPAMQEIFKTMGQVTTSRVSVLITGESGVGKEVISKHIHARSKRYKGPFIAINCAAMPENLLENELFGHEKGAFTGATDLKLGKIELATNGTLFLDEIGDIPISLQAKFLRILQEKKFYRLGGTSEVKVSFRLIAATNKDLVSEVIAKRFREDLYYRLNVIPIVIPPLRQRPDDIPALIDYFIQKYCQDNHITVPRIDGALITHMSRCNWEGNIRQLENTLKRMLVLNNHSLVLADLPEELNKNNTSFLQEALEQRQSLDDVSRRYAQMVLEHFNGNKKEAGQFLQINYRTLQNKLDN